MSWLDKLSGKKQQTETPPADREIPPDDPPNPPSGGTVVRTREKPAPTVAKPAGARIKECDEVAGNLQIKELLGRGASAIDCCCLTLIFF